MTSITRNISLTVLSNGTHTVAYITEFIGGHERFTLVLCFSPTLT